MFEVLPQFRGTASVRQTATERLRLIEFVAGKHQRGRSLRELAEQTGRTQAVVRRALGQEGVARLGRGAQPVTPTRSKPLSAQHFRPVQGEERETSQLAPGCQCMARGKRSGAT